MRFEIETRSGVITPKTTELLVCEGDLREICDRETLNKCEHIIKRAARRKMDEAKRKKKTKKREREKSANSRKKG